MKITKPLEGVRSKTQREFNTWFEKKQKEEGLEYIHIDIDYERIQKDAPWLYVAILPILPERIRNIYNSKVLDKILRSFIDMQAAKTKPFTENF